ncbi:hypothetical protein [Actinomadura rupiterrae]|uniref:hypothetical protein n=1 Tax=Actinomadura rupiterrae TaxID=559627 RepID=UPI0020A37968|nr:hypothetical protein [Actinomadura rupiterrae]MCP2334820.1 hypothetical protein [Actinomadura rupiterrae]
MSARTLLTAVLRDLYPHWDVFVDNRGIWRAAGPTLISASSAEALLDALTTADPDATTKASQRLPAVE